MTTTKSGPGRPITPARLFAAVAAVVAVVAPATAQEFFHRNGLQMRADMASNACRPHSFDVPPLGDAWNVRAAVAFAPPTALVDLSFYRPGGATLGEVVGDGGYLEVTARLPRGPIRRLAVCVGPGADNNGAVIYSVHAGLAGNTDTRVPSASDWTEYDDELYRHLIFDDHETRGRLGTATSRVLRNRAPRFYIRLGGPEGCQEGFRVPLYAMHFWRAIVPVLAEQLTGAPYPYRVEVGCENRPDRPGWVTVHYTTEEEYGDDWGHALARARVGASRGRIWIRWSPHWGGTFRDQHRRTIAHEIGHAFGLLHTNREGSIMRPGAGASLEETHNAKVDVYVFSAGEEDAARRAYRAGRGARYCGDPDECGNGQPSGFRWFDLPEPPVIIVAD